MNLEYQFATAWMMELGDRTIQVLAYLWTEPDDERGELRYVLRIKTWAEDACLGYDLTWPEDKRDRAFEAIAAMCQKGSDARVKVEASIHSLLEEGLKDVGA